MRRWTALARRARWGIADQALSSLTNFGLGLAIARSVTTAEFGAFSLAFATYLLVLVLTRSVVSQPMVIRYSTASAEQWQSAARRSMGATVALGLAAAAAAGLAAALSDGALSAAFAALALTLPGLLVQDSWRFAFFANGNGRSAYFNDVAYAVVLIPLLLFLLQTGRGTVFAATLAWGLAASAAAVYGCWQARVVPSVGAARGWWREHREIIPRYIAEFGSTPAANHAALFAIGGVASLAAVGALRAAEIVLGPVRSLFEGVAQVAQPESVRAVANRGRLFMSCGALSGALALVAATVGAALLLLPNPVGTAILGDTWDAARRVMAPLVVAFVAGGTIVGAQLGLHALVAVRRSMRTRLIQSAAVVALSVAGAAAAGARGAATGRAVAMTAGAVLWWLQFRAAYADHVREAQDN